MRGSARIIQANARNLPLADNSVDLVVMSPPYFALRSYTDNGIHYQGQIGDEPTPAEFVASLIEVTRECMRVLKPSASLWVNLGDKYVPDNRGSGFDTKHAPRGQLGYVTGGMRQKSLMGIPWRYALACIDDLGLILRAEIIWSKPNGLPESVTDRVRRAHEQWFHFTLEPRYFSAVDEIREPHATNALADVRSRAQRGSIGSPMNEGMAGNPLGKLPGSVWTIPTEPLQVPASLGVDHFAAFPTEWPRRIVAGWSPVGVCVACGEGRRPTTTTTTLAGWSDRLTGVDGKPDGRVGFRKSNSHTITGYACACPDTAAPTTPGVVLDPFGGTGTTALVAKTLGRHGISVDMSADYCRLAAWRTTDPDQAARAAQVAKPPRQVDGQDALFDTEATA